MKFITTFLGATAALLLSSGSAFAAGCLPNSPCNVPEPGSLALVAIAAVGVALVSRKKK